MTITRKTRRTRVPKAKRELVLKRDKKFEGRISRLSVRIQRDIEEEHKQNASPFPKNRYLQTVVR